MTTPLSEQLRALAARSPRRAELKAAADAIDKAGGDRRRALAAGTWGRLLVQEVVGPGTQKIKGRP